ncbi:MAG: MCE family protein [Deltaproteobacteria bacterium]|nr:MCE family protein [Deltaproteobacteria bacterium]
MNLKRTTLMSVGIFVAIGLALTMAAVFFIGQEKSLFEKRYTLHAIFKDVSGLRMGAVVQLAGLNVGYVDGVRFPSPERAAGGQLEVILKINKAYEDQIRKDSKVSIQTQGLLGDKYILISTGTPGVAAHKNGDTLITQEATGITVLADVGKKTMEEIQETMRKMREVMDKLPLQDVDQKRFREIMTNIDATTGDIRVIADKVKQGEGTLGAFLMDPSLYNDMRSLLGHANRSKLLKGLIRATISGQDKGTEKSVK